MTIDEAIEFIKEEISLAYADGIPETADKLVETLVYLKVYADLQQGNLDYIRRLPHEPI